MPTKIAMYDLSFKHIAPRLAALDLDLDVSTFSKGGTFLVDRQVVKPADMAVDYCWLGPHVQSDNAGSMAYELLLGCKSIGVLQTFHAGLDHAFYKAIAAKGTRICNSSAQGIAIAEYTVAQVMAVFHPIALQRDFQSRKQWRRTPFREISKSHWLIVGFGAIGQELAKRVKAFGATVSVIRRTPAAHPSVDRAGTMADIGTFAADADVVVLACALNDQTRGLGGADFFAALKPGAVLVNVGRGTLIDDAALLASLDAGRLATAVLDVFNTEPLPEQSPFWSNPNVRLTAHTSFFGSGGPARWDQLFLDNIQRFVRGAKLTGEVDPGHI